MSDLLDTCYVPGTLGTITLNVFHELSIGQVHFVMNIRNNCYDERWFTPIISAREKTKQEY